MQQKLWTHSSCFNRHPLKEQVTTGPPFRLPQTKTEPLSWLALQPLTGQNVAVCPPGKNNVIGLSEMYDSTSLWWKAEMEFRSDFLCCSKVVVSMLRLRMLVLNPYTSPITRTPDYIGRLVHHAFLQPLPPLGSIYSSAPDPRAS